jgi:crotonobetainyl-CoA:carnitine CoA-transferase CaiB-like acyl-CoA transferase
VDEALADAQLAARDMIANLLHSSAGAISVLGVPIKMSATAGSVRTAPPTLGQHTDAVLGEIGYGTTDIARLRAARVI